VVTREESAIGSGPPTFVDVDASLKTAVNKVRTALGDRPRRHGSSRRWQTRLPVHRLLDTAPPRPRRRPWRAAAAAAIAVVAVLGAVFGWSRSHAAPTIRSLAVLPLLNLSNDPEQEYFADGMTDALITDLASIHALRVISRQSVMRYKGSRKPLPEIARELNVDAVVEGSVVRSGARVRVIAQLVDGPTDRHLCAREYEREDSDLLSLQGEVAGAIAREVRVAVRRRAPAGPAAHGYGGLRPFEDAFWNKRTEEGLARRSNISGRPQAGPELRPRLRRHRRIVRSPGLSGVCPAGGSATADEPRPRVRWSE
jgi:TolB-like protein